MSSVPDSRTSGGMFSLPAKAQTEARYERQIRTGVTEAARLARIICALFSLPFSGRGKRSVHHRSILLASLRAGAPSALVSAKNGREQAVFLRLEAGRHSCHTLTQKSE